MQKTLKTYSKKAAVLGSPIAHSLSPVIHNEWARREGVKGLYEAIDAGPNQESFNLTIRKLIAEGYSGANVTLPHKGNALECADEVSQNAKLAGAANMLSLHDGKIKADNSDIFGFSQALVHKLPSKILQKKSLHALILGAGGATRGVIIALVETGITNITITNRTQEKAEQLAEHFQNHYQSNVTIGTSPWEQRTKTPADIVINTTSLGMKGMPALDLEINAACEYLVVADIVYTPLMTPLLKEARSHDIIIIDGLDMLLYQAVPGYKLWLGEEALIDDALKNMIISKLEAKS